jgi:hypothetical protein
MFILKKSDFDMEKIVFLRYVVNEKGIQNGWEKC